MYVCMYVCISIKLTIRTTEVVNINLTDLLFTVRGLQCDMNCGRKIPILRRNLRLPSSEYRRHKFSADFCDIYLATCSQNSVSTNIQNRRNQTLTP